VAQKKIAHSLMHRHFTTVCSGITRSYTTVCI